MARLKQWFEKKSAAKKELKNRKPGSKLLAVEDGKLGFFLGGEGPVKQILKKFTAKVIASAPEGKKVKTRKVKKVRKAKKVARKAKKSAHRGRPKGSKNLKKTARKGRPKGSKNLVKLVKCPCCGEKVNPNRIPIRFSK